MEEIISVKKSPTGLQVSYILGNDVSSELFSYESLIEMKVNIADLMANPCHYAVDLSGPKIVRTDFCAEHLHK
ncbi:hypothetical protein L1994_06920 [Methanomicrobium antiquum]|uniref:Uncharacterized protein n=1 Tax=Methanomicrobium antiquum TaxID=487686 RepID=A0AAF0JT56_9EURY|nr:hypothetical protein [Methanomicrobium antiquum]WFN35893.1 hypothetical protein L1994_06920 [Methanomicrobium antiquum]